MSSIVSGEEKAWQLLSGRAPEDVARDAQVSFDAAEGLYTITSLGIEVSIAPHERKVWSEHPQGDLLLKRLKYFFSLSLLWYLVSAQDIPPSGRLVSPSGLKGGEIYFRGSHILPLDKLAEKYGNDKEGFLRRGKELGGEAGNYGDASVRLLPFPRIPVVLILWLGDEEFPPRVDLLFDSSCEYQVPLDITWSIAMMTVLAML